jgi:transcriptional regulator with XRE-family HTH domain
MKKQVNIFDYNSGIKYLNDYFEEMKTTNPRLSLRSLAAKLGVDQSTLSRYFAGERHISSEKAGEIGPRLKLDATETHYLKLLFLFGDRGEIELLEKLKLSFLFDKNVRDLGHSGIEKFDTSTMELMSSLIAIKKESREKILKAIQEISHMIKEFAVSEGADDLILVSSFMLTSRVLSEDGP